MRVPTLLAIACLASTAAAQHWSRRALASPSPSGSFKLAIAYHPVAKKTLVFGHLGRRETWEWDGRSWRTVSTTGPNGTAPHEMVYDSKRNRIVLAESSFGSFFFATWEWDGSKWIKMSPSKSPVPRTDFSMVFDSKRGVTVLFGGNWGNRHRSDTWEYDGITWKQRSTGGPPARQNAGMAFDEARGETVLFGGFGYPGVSTAYGDTWVWNGTVWREHFGIPSIGLREYAAMTYDPRRKTVILYGGIKRTSPSKTHHDTLEWDGTKWTTINAANTPRLGDQSIITFDRSRGVVVLVGGSSTPQTWEYHNVPKSQGIFSSFGSGCKGSAGVPILAAVTGQIPRIGQKFSIELTALPKSAFARVFGIVSATNSNWSGVPLPLDLRVVGMPGCSLLVGLELPMTNLAIVNQKASWTLDMPHNTFLLGGQFYMQALVFEPGINAFGAIMSNGGAGKIGL